MRFSSIIGHSEIKKQLITTANSGKIAHAQLFFGGEGCANFDLAISFLTYLNCENRTEDDSCGTCSSCSKMDKYIHPDLHFIFPNTIAKGVSKDPESNKFINEWRDFITTNDYFSFPDWMKNLGVENKQGIINVRDGRNIFKTVSLKSFEAEYKSVIIWLPEMMNLECSNAILKLLEEPPEKTLFFLISFDFEKLLPTILSRSQQLYIPEFSDDEIQYYLEKHKPNIPNITQVVRLAEGNMNLALKLSENQDNNLFSFFANWLRICYAGKPSEITKMADEFQKLGREGQKNLFIYGLKLLRNVLLQNVELDAMIKLNIEEKGFIEKITKIMDVEKLDKISEILNNLHYLITRNANAKIVFTNQSYKIGDVFLNK